MFMLRYEKELSWRVRKRFHSIARNRWTRRVQKGEANMKNKFRKVGSASIAAVMMTLAGAGSVSAAATPSPVTISVAAWNDAADSLKAEIPGFEKQYPWIHVKIIYVDGTYQKVIPELTAGVAPDIIQTQQRDFPTFLRMFPSDFVSMNAWMGSIKKQIAPVALSLAEQGGTVYAAPWDLGPTALYYRKDLFQKAGINPHALQTWAEYLAAGKKLVKFYHGKVKMAFANETDPTQGTSKLGMLLNELGGNFTTPAGKIDFTSPQMLTVMNTLQSWSKAGILVNTPNWNAQISAVTNNEVASIIYPVWYAGTLMNSAANQTHKWGVLPLPSFTKGGNNQSDFGGSLLAITKTSQNPQAAWDFIKYSLYTNAGENVQLKFGLFPSWKPYYNTSVFKQSFPYFGNRLYPLFASLSTHIPTMRYGGYYWNYGQPLSQAYESILHGASPLPALKQAATQAFKLQH